jgi:hypothetical protein
VVAGQAESGEQLSAVRIANDPFALQLQLERGGTGRGDIRSDVRLVLGPSTCLHSGGVRMHLNASVRSQRVPVPRVKNDAAKLPQV